MILEEHLAQEISSFAYPFGYYNAAVREMVQQAGYSSACAVKYAFSSTDSDLFALERLIVTENIGPHAFARLLTAKHFSIQQNYQRIRAELWRSARSCRYGLKRTIA